MESDVKIRIRRAHLMKSLRRSFSGSRPRLWLSALVCLLPLWLAAEGRAREPAVILISMDGTRPQDVTLEDLPTLVAMGRRGAVAERLIPVPPSNTFPNHVSLVTGVAPERHGLVNNVFIDAERGFFEKKEIPAWIETEPLWSILSRHGIVSASYYWVGSEGPWRSGHGPAHWVPFSTRTREKAKVEQILAWLALPEPERPRFITSWFRGADHAGHQHGPGSKQVKETLRAQNHALAALLLGLEERGLLDSTTLIVVSDHGMAAATRRVDLSKALAEAGVAARVLGIGGFASVFLDRRDGARDGEGAGRADPRVARVVEIARGLGLMATAREAAPASLRVGHPRFGDVVVRAPVGMAIVYPKIDLIGFHGYDPEHPSMAAIFVAFGRGARPGTRLPPVHSLDVAPTVLALLGVEVPDWMEGQPIAGLLPPAAGQ
jgi:hypothetical protein